MGYMDSSSYPLQDFRPKTLIPKPRCQQVARKVKKAFRYADKARTGKGSADVYNMNMHYKYTNVIMI